MVALQPPKLAVLVQIHAFLKSYLLFSYPKKLIIPYHRRYIHKNPKDKYVLMGLSHQIITHQVLLRSDIYSKLDKRYLDVDKTRFPSKLQLKSRDRSDNTIIRGTKGTTTIFHAIPSKFIDHVKYNKIG